MVLQEPQRPAATATASTTNHAHHRNVDIHRIHARDGAQCTPRPYHTHHRPTHMTQPHRRDHIPHTHAPRTNRKRWSAKAVDDVFTFQHTNRTWVQLNTPGRRHEPPRGPEGGRFFQPRVPTTTTTTKMYLLHGYNQLSRYTRIGTKAEAYH